MSIIGQEIENYTVSQINARQKLHGSGTSTSRTPQQISVLNSNTSWVKLASGVKIDKSKLTELGLPTSLDGMELAKNNVLFGGTSKLVGGERLQQKEGFLPYQSNSSYSHGDFGYSPMPGIISADIKALNRGSLKKATVRFKVHNKQQFDIVDVLYMRLGYTVLLEWGNSMYTSNGTDKQLVQQTIIEDSVRFFSSGYEKGKSYRDMLPVIEFYRNKYDGNYDGLLGKVSNFNWSFQSDGSYDIEITIISLGDVVESLKTNISSNKQLSNFIESALSITPSGSEGNNVIEENADSNDIAAMLYCWKFVNQDSLTYDTYENSIYINRPDVGDRFMGGFLKTSQTVSVSTVTYKFTYVYNDNGTLIYVANEEGGPSSDSYYNTKYISYDVNDDHQAKAEEENDKRTSELFNNPNKLTIPNPNGTGTRSISSYYEKLEDKIIAADSPIKNFGKKDAFFINTEPDKQFYLRFGSLLEYIKNKILPKVNTTKPVEYKQKPPIFSINVDTYGTGKTGNYMYSLPNQISLDPRVCTVKNEKFQTTSGITEVYKHLKPFRSEDYVKTNPNPNKAYIMNIYLNFEFIINCINDNLDERGDIGVFGFLKAICDGLNKSLGGINNLEPIINEDTNTLYIIDTTPIPGLGSQTVPYTLQLFGYNASTSNFVRNVDLKTAITPEYATMITVGATANGYVKGTEATAFSKWNIGLTDRFKEEFIPGNENSSKEGDEDEAASNYTNKFLSAKAGSSSRYGFKGDILSDNAKNLQIDPGAIEKNISVVTEYYKYLIASQKNQQGGTVGFIPFKLNFSMDGISGIKIYNKLHVDTRFLPKAYGTELDLIVTGVSHKLSNDDWETDIETTLIPKTNELKDLVITAEAIVEDINNNPPTNASSGAISGAISAVKEDKIIKFMNNFINFGYSKLQAAAIAGNVLAESGFEEWNVENDKESSRGSGIGLMQWTSGFDPPSVTGRKRFEIFVGKWLAENGVTSKWIKGVSPNQFLDTDPKNHNRGADLEKNLKTIPKLFEAQIALSIEHTTNIKTFVRKNFNGKLSGNTYDLVKNGFFKYAENGKVKLDLGGFTEIFLVDGEVPQTVLNARKDKGKDVYRAQVDKRVALAKECLEIYNNR